MTDDLVNQFLASFDDNRFPSDFQCTYELMECFSHNEIGETLLVKDRQSGDFFIAKCYADKSLLSQFSEGDLLKKLDHEGLPRFIGQFENEKMLCVVRSYSQGKSLDKLVQEKPLTGQQSIDITIQLCEILNYLHEQTPPIIHRDIKPQNIIVNEQGEITLIDFGISRAFDVTANEDTICYGTRYFAAPEQYGFSQTDCRTDIFSLGVLLYWLLTGKVEIKDIDHTVPNIRLARIISKCTSFAPKDRYKSAAQVKDALTGRSTRLRVLSVCFATFLLLIAYFLFAEPVRSTIQQIYGVNFSEPQIEEAARLALHKTESEALTEQDMLFITELYVFGDKPAENQESFNRYANSFVNSSGLVQRGMIDQLDDLSKLKNLRRISLVYQNITDLTPLSGLVYLESVDLRHNPIDDLSPLAMLPSLSSLFLFDTHVSDLTALRSCSHLSTLDIGLTQVKSVVALDGLDSLQVLMLRKSPLHSLDHIETHPMLEQIILSETQLLDLSPLLELPRLQVVEVSENMRTAAEDVARQAQFNIIYR